MTVIRILLALAAAAALILVAPARAAEDGGVTSVFSEGAGSRALALGGAFAAISDDASAPLWNPAGLGSLQRNELQAMQANLYGLDISEQYAVLALPSWRWGTGALVFRRFGVGGIERRDDRNVLIEDDLSDSQSQLQLAYGRALNDTWSVGGSVKLHRQSLAGYSAMGIGMDLGVMTRPGLILGSDSDWVNRFTLGMTLQNALEPSLRLDQESVEDPASLRAGFAFRQPYRLGGLGPGYALASFDVVRTKGTDTETHAGLEVVPHPLLALRMGVNDGEFSAGTGLRWDLYSFDYVMENTPIDTVHRFGLSLQFGRTVTERRLAAARKQEEEFAERLAATFEEREAARIRELLERARGLMAQEQIDAALEQIVTVTALDPENTEARELEARALRAKAARRERDGALAEASVLYGRVLAIAPDDAEAQAGLDRCRAESDLRAARGARIRDLFGAALDAFTAGDLAEARSGFRGILDLSPGDGEAQAMLARTESAIRARTSDLLAQAGRFLDRGLLDETADLLAQVRELDGNARGLAELSTGVARKRSELADAARRKQREAEVADTETPVVATVAPPALSKKKRKEIADLYERGMDAMEDARADDALRYWELVWLADPAYLNVADYLKREYLLRGLESFSKGQLEDAVGLWERALKVDPEDERTLGYLQRAREQQTRTREILGPGAER